MSNSSPLQAYARQSALGFTALLVPHIHGGRQFSPNWVTRAANVQLRRLDRGDITQLALDMPSLGHVVDMVGIGRALWRLARNPTETFLVVVNDTQAADIAKAQVTAAMSSGFMTRIFGSFGAHTVDHGIQTTSGGALAITHVGGPLPDSADHIAAVNAILPDYSDPWTTECPDSDWCLEELFPKLQESPSSTIVVLNQRTGINDLMSRLAFDQSEEWDRLHIPAFSTTVQRIQIRENGGGSWHVHRDGDCVPFDHCDDGGAAEMLAVIPSLLYDNPDDEADESDA